MSTIKRNSWHFKLLSRESECQTLKEAREGRLTKCKYYSRVFLHLLGWTCAILMGIVMAVVVVMMVYLWGYGIYSIIVYAFFDPAILNLKNTLAGIFLLLCALAVILIIWGPNFYYHHKDKGFLCKLRGKMSRLHEKICKPVKLE